MLVGGRYSIIDVVQNLVLLGRLLDIMQELPVVCRPNAKLINLATIPLTESWQDHGKLPDDTPPILLAGKVLGVVLYLLLSHRC